MTSMTKTIETVGGSDLEKGRVSSAATAPAAAQGAVPPTPRGNIIVGDPRMDEGVFAKLVDTVVSAFFEGRDGVVYVGFRIEGRSCMEYFILARPLFGSGDYMVIMDEDGRPLYVVDRTAMTWDEAVTALLSFIGKEEGILEVTVELGERW